MILVYVKYDNILPNIFTFMKKSLPLTYFQLIVIMIKSVLRNFANFTGKYLYQSLFQSLRPANFIKKNTDTGVFL